MKKASISWIWLNGFALAQAHTIDGEGGRRRGTSNNGTSSQSPACVRTCEEQLRPEHSCNFDLSAQQNDCCMPELRTELTSCIQAACPNLADLTSWQKQTAAACNIQPRNDGERQIIVSYALFAVSTLSMAGRMLSRSNFTSGPGFWWDDWVALIVWIFSLELLACLPFLHNNRAGEDIIGPVTAENVKQILRWEYISIPFYLIATYGAKISLVLLYMRMWEANTFFRKFCWISIFTLLAGIVGFSVSGLVITWPLRYYIGDTPRVRQNFYGVSIYPAIFSIAAMNVGMDFWVILMPITKLMALRGLSKRRRNGIMVVFLLGFTVTACSIVRITYITPLRNSTNPSWDFGHFGVWSEIETHLSLVACNLPAMAGLIHRLRSKYKSRRATRMHSSEVIRTRPLTTMSAVSVTNKEYGNTDVQAWSDPALEDPQIGHSQANGERPHTSYSTP